MPTQATITLYMLSAKDANGDYTLGTSVGSSLGEEGFGQTVYLSVYAGDKTTALSAECSVTITASSYTAYSCSTTFNAGVVINQGDTIYVRLRDSSKTVWFSWVADEKYDVDGQNVSFTIYGYYDDFIGLAYVGFGDSTHDSRVVITYLAPVVINVVVSATQRLRDAYNVVGNFAVDVVFTATQRLRDRYRRVLYRFWNFEVTQRLKDAYDYVHYARVLADFNVTQRLRDAYSIPVNTVVNAVFSVSHRLRDSYNVFLFKARRCCRKLVRS